MTDHAPLLTNLVDQVGNTRQIHQDPEPQERCLVGVQEDRRARKPNDRQDVGQVMGAARKHSCGARAGASGNAPSRGSCVQAPQGCMIFDWCLFMSMPHSLS
jgi:hypothetical protein